MVTMTLPVEVPLEDCEPDPRFLYRVRYDVDDLVESVRRGQIHPALAWRREDGKYMVFAGVRRLMAARAARERYGEPTTFLVRLVSPDAP
ncbi:MAG: ParB N-terminal domain-containing protein, partial [Conexivisphaera sp.]